MTVRDIGPWIGVTTGEVALAAGRGVEGAFESLYHRFGGRVFGLCLRLSGDDARARDLTQDVFVRVWERLHLLRDPATFRSWLRQVTTNMALNELRSARRREARVLAVANPEEFHVPGAPPTDLLLTFEAAVDELPEQHRIVFILHDVEGYAHTEIATMIGVPIATIRVHLHRARMQLRRVITR